MRFLLRPANLYLLLTYLALSAVPFVPMLLGKPLERPWQVLGVEFVGWVAAWAVFKRPAWFHWLLIPAFLALPTEVYLFTYYGQGISTHHLGIIAETSPKEALEFLGQKVWLMLAVMVGVIAWWVTSFRAARKTRDLDWSDPSRWVALGALALGAGALGCMATNSASRRSRPRWWRRPAQRSRPRSIWSRRWWPRRRQASASEEDERGSQRPGAGIGGRPHRLEAAAAAALGRAAVRIRRLRPILAVRPGGARRRLL